MMISAVEYDPAQINVVRLYEDSGGTLYLETQVGPRKILLSGLESACHDDDPCPFALDALTIPLWYEDWGESDLTCEEWGRIRDHSETRLVSEWSREHGVRILAPVGRAAQRYLGLSDAQSDWALIRHLLSDCPDGIPIAALRRAAASAGSPLD